MGLELSLSDKCNLRCPFCYTAHHETNEADWERTRRILHWYFDKHPTPERSISVFGGEPLYEWGDLMKLCDWRDAREKADGQRISLGIVTNMTLLSEERLKVLVDRRVGISPSIDGCPEAQNKGRIFPDGSGSANIVYENAKRLLKYRPHISCRATIAPGTVHMMAESVRFLHEEIGFKTINPVYAGGCEWTPEALAEWDYQLSLISDWMISLHADGKPLPDLFHTRNTANVMKLAKSGKRVGTCKCGIGRVAVDTNGDLWPCHRFTNPASSQDWKLGNIEMGITNHELVSAISNFDPANDVAFASAGCKTCTLRDYCYAMCWWEVMTAGTHRFYNGRILIQPPREWCHIWRGIYREGTRVCRAVGLRTIQEITARPRAQNTQPKPTRKPHHPAPGCSDCCRGGGCSLCDQGPCIHCDQCKCVTTDNPEVVEDWVKELAAKKREDR